MDQNNKTAVVYFSMSAHSERLARKLAQDLNGDLIALNAPRYRRGVLGYMRAGFDSLWQKRRLAPQGFKSLSQYSRLVLCGPVWTSYPATPLRALLASGIDLPHSVSLFLTSGDHSSAQRALSVAEKDLGLPLSATAVLVNSAEKTPHETETISRFLRDLDAGRVRGPTSVP